MGLDLFNIEHQTLLGKDEKSISFPQSSSLANWTSLKSRILSRLQSPNRYFQFTPCLPKNFKQCIKSTSMAMYLAWPVV
jgi:hypothetical protein